KGRVVAETGQTPAAKAAISVDDWPVATTADDGSFTIPHAARDWQDIQTREGSLGSMRARAGEAAVNLRLAKLGKITGTVRDAKTQLPLAGAEVRIGPANLFGRVRGFGGGGIAGTGAATDSVMTDAKGAFTITAS